MDTIGQQESPVKSDRTGRPNKGSETPVGTFVDAYREKYQESPDMNPAARNNIHRALEGLDPAMIRAVVDEYLSSREPFFADGRHPGHLFVTWWKQKRAKFTAKPAERPYTRPVPVEEIEAEFVGTPEERRRAAEWARRNS